MAAFGGKIPYVFKEMVTKVVRIASLRRHKLSVKKRELILFQIVRSKIIRGLK